MTKQLRIDVHYISGYWTYTPGKHQNTLNFSENILAYNMGEFFLEINVDSKRKKFIARQNILEMNVYEEDLEEIQT